MSRILSRISMFTGQISSHALHDVHDHSSSAVMRSKRLSAVTVISRSMPTGGETGGVPVSGHHLAGLVHDLARVERLARRVRRADRRAAAADRARVGVEELLPREVLDGRRAERLELGLHQVRHLAHRALRARPVLQVHVHRARDHVPQHRGGQDHEEREERDDVDAHAHRCRSSSVLRCASRRRSTRTPSRRTTTSRSSPRAAAPRAAPRCGTPSVTNPVTPMIANVAEDHEVLGLGLDPDPVRPLPRTAGRTPTGCRRGTRGRRGRR